VVGRPLDDGRSGDSPGCWSEAAVHVAGNPVRVVHRRGPRAPTPAAPDEVDLADCAGGTVLVGASLRDVVATA